MSEAEVVGLTSAPATAATIEADLRALGIGDGDVVVVHSSLSSLGFVVGGAQAVVEALLAAVGSSGTVTMPAHSADWSEPSYWEAPPVPPAWWPVIREHLPAYDPHTTPLRGMGAIAEALHRVPGTRRSAHPRLSHMAHGPHADRIVGHHPLPDGFAESSPLARLHELDATVVLIGVGHANNTSLHLAECRATWPGKARVTQGSAVLMDGVRTWVTYDEDEADPDDFPAVGAAFAGTGGVRTGRVAQAEAMVMSQRALVDFAVGWFASHRGAQGPERLLAPS